MTALARRKFLKYAGGAGLAAGLKIGDLETAGRRPREGEPQERSAYKVGMGQMLVRGGEVEKNLGRAVDMVRGAAERGCAAVLLPECLDCGWTHPASRGLAQPIPGRHSDRLAAAAAKHGIHVVAGLTEKAGSRVYNAAVLISPRGEILLHHRKINELVIAHDIYDIGDRLGVARTPLGTIGLDICADNFPDALVIGHTLGRMGAQIMLSPSAWAVRPGHDNAKDPYGGSWRRSFATLARLYDMTVISVSNVGPMDAGVWAGRACIGCSMAVGPDGAVLAQCPYGREAETLEAVDVALTPRKAKGTAISAMLKDKGFELPDE